LSSDAAALTTPAGAGRTLERAWSRNGWWIVRVLMLPVNLFVFAVVVFFLVRLLPGDPAQQVTGGQANEAQLEQVRQSLGLSGSLGEQLIVYLGRLVSFDLGTSITTGTPVFPDVMARLPQTLELTVTALVLATVLACGLSAVAVFRPKNPVAGFARGYSRAAGALPDFTVGIVAILLFYVLLRIAPAPIGRYDGRMSAPTTVTGLPYLDALLSGDAAVIGSATAHLVLPLTAMTIAYTPYLMKQLVFGLSEQLAAPATRFRIASGAGRPMTVLSVFRRAFPAVAVVSGSLLSSLLGGAVIMESMFNLGGIGQYAVDAVTSSDYPATQGVLLVIVAVVLVIFLLVDILTLALDPRRRSGATSRGDS
jgi:peptide/nickel transport system permease protein